MSKMPIVEVVVSSGEWRANSTLPESEDEIVLAVDVLNVDLDDTLEQTAEQLLGVADEKVGLLRVEVPRTADEERERHGVLLALDDDLRGEQIVKGARDEASDEDVVAHGLRLVLALEQVG